MYTEHLLAIKGSLADLNAGIVIERDRSLTVLEAPLNSALSITAIISLSKLNNKELFSLLCFLSLKRSKRQGKPSADSALKIFHCLYIASPKTKTRNCILCVCVCKLTTELKGYTFFTIPELVYNFRLLSALK